MIRDAQARDAAAIAAIWNPIILGGVATFWPTPRSTDEISAMIAERRAQGRAFLVYQPGGTVLGFGTYTQFRGGPGYARSVEHSLHLAPEARGRGSGRRLLHALEDHARGAGNRIMVAGITGSNAGSIAFHTALGYARWGMIPHAGCKFGRFHDLVLMGKDLTTAPDPQ